jgi:hypothetical protein
LTNKMGRAHLRISSSGFSRVELMVGGPRQILSSGV